MFRILKELREAEVFQAAKRLGVPTWIPWAIFGGPVIIMGSVMTALWIHYLFFR